MFKEKLEMYMKEGKAGIYDTESAYSEDSTSTTNSSVTRYNPDSIRCAFRPLGIFAKIFGLFPCYDLSFDKKNEHKKISRITRVLDYCYTAFICIVFAGGGLICTLEPPRVMLKLYEIGKTDTQRTNYFVLIAIFYVEMITGLTSMFIFPKANHLILEYVDHFANIDKIMKFDGKWEEKHLGIKIVFGLAMILIGTIISAVFIHLLDLPEEDIIYTDYIITCVTIIAGIVAIIPTAMAMFFTNAIRLRLVHFNKRMKVLILPITPSCSSCKCYKDYGKELDDDKMYKKSLDLALDLEKMRILHEEISTIAGRTSHIFGFHFIREAISSIAGIILYTFVLLYIRDEYFLYWFFYIFLDIFIIFKLLVISCFAQAVTNEGEASRKILCKASVRRISNECNIQVQMFIKKLDTPIEITAFNYFTINRQLITSIFGAITTYFIILIQFRTTDSKAACNSTVFQAKVFY